MAAKGHIRQRPSGSWVVVLPITRRDGTKAQKWFTAPTREAAVRLRARLVHELAEGTYLDAANTPLAEFLAEWLAHLATRGRRPSTLETYQQEIERHIGPALGRTPLSKLTPRQIEGFLSRELTSGRMDGKGGLANNTVRLHHCILTAALHLAVRWGMLGRSPMGTVDLPPPGAPKGRALSEGELRRLHAEVRGSELEVPVLLAALCGMRQAEILALRWEDVDADNRVLHVRQSKTGAGIRPIAVPAVIGNLLAARRQESGPVVVREDGKPWRYGQALTILVRRAAEAAGLGYLRFHDLKHTCGTVLLAGGRPPLSVSRRLGHSSPAVTLRVYAHVLEEHDRADADWLDGRFGGEADTENSR